MNRDTIDWSGPMPAVTTPFNVDMSVDEESFVANVKRLFDAGATGMVGAGCTGEFWALRPQERQNLARLAVETCDGRGPIIIGAAGICEEEVIEQIAAAKEVGADAALVLPPYFVKVTDVETIAHLEAIADRSELPVVLYNIPGNAGNAITPDIADRLADHDKVVATKVNGCLSSNNAETLKQAALDHLGIIYAPKCSVYEELALGKLVTVLPTYKPRVLGVYAVYPYTRHKPKKIALLIEHIRDAYQALNYYFE